MCRSPMRKPSDGSAVWFTPGSVTTPPLEAAGLLADIGNVPYRFRLKSVCARAADVKRAANASRNRPLKTRGILGCIQKRF